MDNSDICKKNPPSIQTDFLQKHESSNKKYSSMHLKHLVSSIYQALQSFYQEHRKNQTIAMMLNRMTNSKNISSEFYNRPLLKLLEEICDVLMMEELEISLWYIYLENIIWRKTALYCENEIWFAAYAAKKSLNEELEIYNKILVEKIPNFFQLYESWKQQHQSDLTVDPIYINETYNKLAKITKKSPLNVLNYNYYLDKIFDSLTGVEIMKKRFSGNDEDIRKKKRKLYKNKEKIIFGGKEFAENSIKDDKNGTKQLKMLPRDEIAGSLRAQNTDTVKNEEQKKGKYFDQKIDIFSVGKMGSNELDVDYFSRKDWIV